MGKLPILKPREVCGILEPLASFWCANAAHIGNIAIRTAEGRRCRTMPGGTFLRSCFDRLREISERPLKSSSATSSSWHRSICRSVATVSVGTSDGYTISPGMAFDGNDGSESVATTTTTEGAADKGRGRGEGEHASSFRRCFVFDVRGLVVAWVVGAIAGEMPRAGGVVRDVNPGIRSIVSPLHPWNAELC